MESSLITCDVCGCHKREVNHWFTSKRNPGRSKITFDTANAIYRSKSGVKHICGIQCLNKLLSQWAMRAIEAEIKAAAAKKSEGNDESERV